MGDRLAHLLAHLGSSLGGLGLWCSVQSRTENGQMVRHVRSRSESGVQDQGCDAACTAAGSNISVTCTRPHRKGRWCKGGARRNGRLNAYCLFTGRGRYASKWPRSQYSFYPTARVWALSAGAVQRSAIIEPGSTGGSSAGVRRRRRMTAKRPDDDCQ